MEKRLGRQALRAPVRRCFVIEARWRLPPGCLDSNPPRLAARREAIPILGWEGRAQPSKSPVLPGLFTPSVVLS
jgi:hypothetical protein